MGNKIIHSLADLNVLVCGSTNGIGLATAKEFAELGANVTLFARNVQKLKDTLSVLNQSKKSNHDFLNGDFNNPSEVRKKIENHVKSGKQYHVLINNSGGPKGGAIINASSKEFIEAFNRHLICNQIITQSIFPGMKRYKYGRIINIISTSVKEPIQELGVSNTIRGAVSAWAKTLSKEVAEYGITVNSVLPGFTETERLSKLIKAKSIVQKKAESAIITEMKKQIPLGRFASPTEIAKTIIFLASPASSYINGISLAVDGGRLNSI